MKANIIFILLLSIAFGCSEKPEVAQLPVEMAANNSPTKVAELTNQFLAFESEKGFSGAVMIFENGKLSFQKGYGFTDAKQSIPIDENTLFDMGSITKTFTATAILKLEEMGKLSTEDLISKYFKDVPEDKQNMTLHHLLTHSSGLPAAIGHDYDAATRDNFLEKTWSAELIFPVGKGYEYSNVGFSLLGMIIEKVSNESYDSFLQKNIFQPAGMTNTGYNIEGMEKQKVAHGIDEEGEDWGSPRTKNWNGNSPFWHLKANGGLLTTAHDMGKWCEAVVENKILKPETWQKQMNGYVDEGEGSYYGYGVVEFQKGKHYGHNGGNGIFRADWHFFPEKKSALFVVSNAANIPLFQVSDDLLSIMMTEKLPRSMTLKQVDLEEFPANEMQQNAMEFLKNVQSFDSGNLEKFIDEKFTEKIVEKNTKERLMKIFQQIENEFKGGELTGVAAGDNYLELKVKGKMEMLSLNIDFVDGKIDRFGVEVGD
ncbi:MAG: serine hydrolase domain-containing protein [Saprospiraceae bacterium]